MSWNEYSDATQAKDIVTDPLREGGHRTALPGYIGGSTFRMFLSTIPHYLMRIFLLTVLLSLMPPFSVVFGQVGDRAPSFTLRDVNGASSGFDRFQGKVVLVNFWAPWCVSCREELPELERLYALFKEKEFVVIGVNVEGSRARTERMLKRLALTFPLLTDESGDAAEAYQVSRLPTSFLIGRDGVIRRIYQGFERDMIPCIERDISEQLIR